MHLYDFLGPDHNEVIHVLKDILPNDLCGLTMLDLASGEGKHLQAFLERNIDKVYAIDWDKIRLKNLKNKYRYYSDKINIIHDDIFKRRFQNKYDLIYLGDNTIQYFDTYKSQYNIINIISDTLNKTGIGIINFTPLSEKNILDFACDYKALKSNKNMLFGKIQVDIFNQNLIYLFKSKTYIKTIKTRILLKKELEDMIECAGLIILKIHEYVCNLGNTTFFYIVKLNT